LNVRLLATSPVPSVIVATPTGTGVGKITSWLAIGLMPSDQFAAVSQLKSEPAVHVLLAAYAGMTL
jgi:hypothetical protein